MRTLLVAGIAFGLLLSSPGRGAAATPEEVRAATKEHYLKGTTAFDVGKYDEAIKEYIAAYEVANDPVFLYNIAQAHRLAEHAAEALRFYKTYLSKVPAARNRAEVEGKIEELKKLVEQQKRTREMPPDHTISTAPAGTSNVDSGGAGRTKKIAGLTVAVAGVGLLVGGIVCGALAKSAGDQLTQLDRTHQPFDPSLESAGKTNTILAGVFVGVGAAAVVAGVVVFAAGLVEGNRARRAPVTVLPLLSPTTAGAAMTVAF